MTIFMFFMPAAEVPANPEQHIRREELDHYLPAAS